MLHFLSTLTPEQWAVVLSVVTPFVHYLATRWVDFENKHREAINWLVSFVLPGLGTLATFLATNTSFTHLVPIYGTIYAGAQLVYYVTVRTWNKNKVLQQQLLKLIEVTAPTTPVVPVAETII